MRPSNFSKQRRKAKGSLMRLPCCLYVCMCTPLNAAMERLGKHILEAMNTHAIIQELLGTMPFYIISIFVHLNSLFITILGSAMKSRLFTKHFVLTLKLGYTRGSLWCCVQFLKHSMLTVHSRLQVAGCRLA
jgi:hypothetical protein